VALVTVFARRTSLGFKAVVALLQLAHRLHYKGPRNGACKGR
jgi:hypothetical protein